MDEYILSVITFIYMCTYIQREIVISDRISHVCLCELSYYENVWIYVSIRMFNYCLMQHTKIIKDPAFFGGLLKHTPCS